MGDPESIATISVVGVCLLLPTRPSRLLSPNSGFTMPLFRPRINTMIWYTGFGPLIGDFGQPNLQVTPGIRAIPVPLRKLASGILWWLHLLPSKPLCWYPCPRPKPSSRVSGIPVCLRNTASSTSWSLRTICSGYLGSPQPQMKAVYKDEDHLRFRSNLYITTHLPCIERSSQTHSQHSEHYNDC